MAARIIIGFLLVVLCALTGRALAMKSIVEADGIRRFQEDIFFLRMLTIQKRLPAQQALSKLKNGVFQKMGLLMEKDAHLSIKNAWEKAMEGENIREDAGKALKMLFEALESLSRDQQSAQYDRAQEDLKRFEGEVRKKGLEKVKLYTSLGAVSGVCLFLLCV